MQKQAMIIIAVALFIIAALLGLAIFAVLYVTSGQTYSVPVVSSDLPANHRIQQYELRVEDFDSEPGPQVIMDKDELIGKVTTRSLSEGQQVSTNDIRDDFEVFTAVEDIPLRQRIETRMVQRISSQNKPANAISDPAQVQGRMTNRLIEEDEIITLDDVHLEEQQVVVARSKITPNTILRADQVKVEQRPVDIPDAVNDLEEVVGRPIRSEIRPGEVLRSSDLYEETLQLSYFIPLYKRAVSVPVANYNSVSHMARPGDLIDLYVYTPLEVGEQTATRVLGQDMEVHTLQKIADGAEILTLNDPQGHTYSYQGVQNSEEGEQAGNMQRVNYQSVTMGVDLIEAEKVNLVLGMKQQGMPMRFFVILRPRILESKYGLRRMTETGLFSRDAGRSMDRAIESRSIEVIQGDQTETFKVPRY